MRALSNDFHNYCIKYLGCLKKMLSFYRLFIRVENVIGFIVALKWEGIATPFEKREREAGENQPKIGRQIGHKQ